MKTDFQNRKKKGFTLLETLFVATISLMLVTGVISSMLFHVKAFQGTSTNMAAAKKASHINNLMVYGTNFQPGLREADASSIPQVIPLTASGWELDYATTSVVTNNGAASLLVTSNKFAYLSNLGIIVDGNANTLADGILTCTISNLSGILVINMTTEDTFASDSSQNNISTKIYLRN